MSNQILHPGEYFIELEFDRPVDPAVLHRALTSMGFGVVVFDQSMPTIEVGAMALGRPAATASLARSSVSPVARAIAPAPAPASAPTLSKPPVFQPATPTVSLARPAATIPVPNLPPAPSSQRSVVSIQSRYTQPIIQALADGGGPTALKPSTSSPIAKAKSLLPSALSASPSAITAPKAPFPGDVPASSVAAPATSPVAAALASDSGGGGGGGGGGASSASPDGGGEADAGSPAPAPDAAPPINDEPSSIPAPSLASLQGPSPLSPETLTERWTKWKEWGSPFATGPMSVSGTEEGDNSPLRFRILARLDSPIALDDRPGMRWLFVKQLSFPFLSDLSYQANPHTLRQGSLYELRFLSRAKSNPSRESVKQSLTDMGFSPVKLLAFKRNMTLPRRPASLTLWYGMAVWNHADSVIIHDDPFFFETVKEIRPL